MSTFFNNLVLTECDTKAVDTVTAGRTEQLGRRNITNEQRLRLIGQMQENRKKSVGEHKGNQYSGKMELVQNEPIPKSTASQIAQEIGVGRETVKRAEKFAKGLDKIAEVSPEAVERNRKE